MFANPKTGGVAPNRATLRIGHSAPSAVIEVARPARIRGLSALHRRAMVRTETSGNMR